MAVKFITHADSRTLTGYDGQLINWFEQIMSANRLVQLMHYEAVVCIAIWLQK